MTGEKDTTLLDFGGVELDDLEEQAGRVDEAMVILSVIIYGRVGVRKRV